MMDVRSARLYGQFSLDKTLTLQAGSTVMPIRAKLDFPVNREIGKPAVRHDLSVKNVFTGKFGSICQEEMSCMKK